MNEIDSIYQKLLLSGLVSIRRALQLGEHEYCKCEIEHLHYLPTLIGEKNILRHLYYARGTRALYRKCPGVAGNAYAAEHIETFYEGQWKKLDRILEDWAKNSQVSLEG